VQTIGGSLTLSKDQWTLLHAVADSSVPFRIASADGEFLLGNGLIEPFGDTWRVTEDGHLLAAMRRQI